MDFQHISYDSALCAIFSFPEEDYKMAVGYQSFIQDDFDEPLQPDENHTYTIIWPTNSPVLPPKRMHALNNNPRNKLQWKEYPAMVLRTGSFDDMKNELKNFLQNSKFEQLTPAERREKCRRNFECQISVNKKKGNNKDDNSEVSSASNKINAQNKSEVKACRKRKNEEILGEILSATAPASKKVHQKSVTTDDEEKESATVDIDRNQSSSDNNAENNSMKKKSDEDNIQINSRGINTAERNLSKNIMGKPQGIQAKSNSGNNAEIQLVNQEVETISSGEFDDFRTPEKKWGPSRSTANFLSVSSDEDEKDFRPLSQMTAEELRSKVRTLQMENRDLRHEVGNYRTTFATFKGIQKLKETVEQACKNFVRSPSSVNSNPGKKSDESKFKKRVTYAEISLQPKEGEIIKEIKDYFDDEVKFLKCRTQCYSKLICDLIDGTKTTEELRKLSVTGDGGEKSPYPIEELKSIANYVRKIHPDVSDVDILNVVKNKINNAGHKKHKSKRKSKSRSRSKERQDSDDN